MVDPISSKLNHSIEILSNLNGAPKASDLVDVKETKRSAAKESKEAPALIKARSGFWAAVAKFLSGSPPSPSKTITKNLKLIQKNLQQAKKEVATLETTINSFRNKFLTNKNGLDTSFPDGTLNLLKNTLEQAKNALSSLSGNLQITSNLEGKQVQLLENCKSTVIAMAKQIAHLSDTITPEIFQNEIIAKIEKDFKNYETSSRGNGWRSEASHNQAFNQYKTRLAKLKLTADSPLYAKYKELESAIETATNRFKDNQSYRADKISANIKNIPILLGNKLPNSIIKILPMAMQDPASNEIIEALMTKGKDTPLSTADIRNLEAVVSTYREFATLSYVDETKTRNAINEAKQAQNAVKELVSSSIDAIENAFDNYKNATNLTTGIWTTEDSLHVAFKKFSQQLLDLKITRASPHFERYHKLLRSIEEAQNKYANDAEYRNAKIKKTIELLELTIGKKLPEEIVAALRTIMKSANNNQQIESLIARGKETISPVYILDLMNLFSKAKNDEIISANASYKDIKETFDPAIRELVHLAIISINKSLQNSTVKKIYAKFTALVGPDYPFPLKQKFALVEAIKMDPSAMEEFVNIALINKKSALEGSPVPGMSEVSVKLQGLLASKLEGFATELFPIIMLFRIKAGESVNLQLLTDSMRFQLVPTMTKAEIGNGPTFRYLENLQIGKKQNLLLTIPEQERSFAQDGYIRSALNHQLWERSSWQEEPPLVFRWTASLITNGKQPIHSTAILNLSCLKSLPADNRKALFFFIHDWVNSSPDLRAEIEKKLDEVPLKNLITAEVRGTFMKNLRAFSEASAKAVVDIYMRLGEKQPKPPESKVSESEAQNAMKNKLKQTPPFGT